MTVPTATLTPDTLLKLTFKTVFHLRCGGNSILQKSNDEWGLVLVTTTNGSPRYEVASKYLAGRGIELDLLAKPVDLEGFCKRFNEAGVQEPDKSGTTNEEARS